jgi:hypothetical protein
MKTIELKKGLLTRIANYTDNNYHTKALITISNKFGLLHISIQLKKVEKMHLKIGYLSDDLSYQRKELSKLMLNYIKDNYSKETFELIWSCL